ncbi:class Ib ribonucleoside-diphosphate reductase assembly flavoprotein NrdI [Streptococcus caprae]|uniref:Putative NrdI-like protein n=1 Tax=Streptococcus caprae TaxID=1640501 RepID=A0ABV8CV45_9STRE
MKLVYTSITGQSHRFVKKLDWLDKAIRLGPQGDEPNLTEDFLLLVPTYESGLEYVDDFLEDHLNYCKGILGSGNRNFGPDFCHTAKRLSKTYGLPLLHTFEYSGAPHDIDYVKGILAHES